VVNAISQMSNSSPRHIRRIAAVIGSISSGRSSSRPGFTAPCLIGFVSP
jgi:hypothetical protein